MSHRRTRASVLALALGALSSTLAASAPSQAQTLRVGVSRSFSGGVTTDGWSVVSSETQAIAGEFRLRIPRGGRVTQAILYSTVHAEGGATVRPVPAGPSGSPRQVTVGTGASRAVRSLEGMPTYTARDAGGREWGTFVFDVTEAVRSEVGASASGGIERVTVSERGDAHWNHMRYPQYLGHTLVVLYDLEYAPLRSVVVFEGAAINGYTSPMLALPAPAANRCPAGSTRGEPFAASLSVHWEYNRCEENSTVRVNDMVLTTRAGGADDWDQLTDLTIPRPSGIPTSEFDPTACYRASAALATSGSFGGSEASTGLAAGAPVGTDGDSITGAHTPTSRLDDELYDFRRVLADGDATVRVGFEGDNNELLSVVVLQMLGRRALGDADSDGHSDVVEGDCTSDTDRDGNPDYLDEDSDNDCLPDRMETAEGRTNPMIPGGADANCTEGAPVCDTTIGACTCRANSDCGGTRPICDMASRFCVECSTDAQCAGLSSSAPYCVPSGTLAGACVQCRSDANCPATAPVCDVATGTCGDPDTDRDGLRDSVERRLSTDPMNPDSDGDGLRDGLEVPDVESPRNTDGDATIDALDSDDDGDGISTETELRLDTSMGDDFDADGTPSYLDLDSDDDGLTDRAEGADDRDGDGKPEFLDPADDTDGDTVPNTVERGGCSGSEPGCVSGDRDTDRDGTPDYRDEDDDGDGIPTRVERELDPSMGDDLDRDGVPSYRDTDADGDDDLDREEAGSTPAMPVNTDRASDGPDFLDRDSDNDCALDNDPREDGAARVTPATMPDAHCAGSSAGPVCDTRSGECTGCFTDAMGTVHGCDASDDGRVCRAAASSMERPSCGCNEDADCPEGRACNTETHRCEVREVPDAGMEGGTGTPGRTQSGCGCVVAGATSSRTSSRGLAALGATLFALALRSSRRRRSTQAPSR